MILARLRRPLLFAVLTLLLLLAVFLFSPERADVAAYAQLVDDYETVILRDAWGVPHVFGRRDADAAFGLAYAHAEDDFATIQEAVALARGQLAYYQGRDAAPIDYLVGLLRAWDDIAAGYESELRSDTRLLLESYAAGLNYYAARHPDEAWPGLYPLTGQDVVAGFVVRTPFFFGLDQVLEEIFAETRARPVSGRTGADADSWLGPIRGSNALAVGPARSADGGTYLAINSHQPWTGPVAWYEAHVRSEAGWNMVGALFPGSPVVLVGHNDYLGWAFTVNSPDLVDVFILDINPDDPNQYRFDGEWRELEVRPVPIQVRIAGRFRWTVNQEALWSVYGPTIRRPHGTYAIRYAGMGELGLVQQWYDMNRATSLTEWLGAMQTGALPMFNAAYADGQGNIYYLYNALLPLRAAGYDWSAYLPGDRSETLWQGYLPLADLPQVLNPPSGFIQNANSSPFQTTLGEGNPDPGDYSPVWGIETRMSNRALRALELLGEDEAISWEEFIGIKFDLGYHPESDMGRIKAAIREYGPADTPAQAEALALLNAWDGRTTPDSAGASVAILTLYYVRESGGADLHISNMVGGDIPPEVVQHSFQLAVDHLLRHFGRVDTPWNEVNRLQRGDLNLGLGGGPDVMHAVYGEMQADGRFAGIAGDSSMFLVRWDAAGAIRSFALHQFGSATLDAASPHFADQAPLFVARQLREVWFSEAAIRTHLARAYVPGDEP